MPSQARPGGQVAGASGTQVKRRKTQHDNQPFPDENPFDILPDDDDMSLSSISSNILLSRPNTRKQQPSAAKQVKSMVPPPIVIPGNDITSLRAKLSKLDAELQSKILVSLAPGEMKIKSNDMDTFTAIKKFCTDKQLIGHTYTPKQDRYVKICMYGLWRMNDDDVKNELIKKQIDVQQVKQLTIKNQRFPNEAIYLLYFKRSQKINLNDCRKVVGLFGITVRFKYYKNKNKEPSQCAKCQQFGHGAVNCFYKPACVRCGEGHFSDDCPKVVELAEGKKGVPDDLVKCALCGKNHTANYRQCEKRIEYKELITKSITKPEHKINNIVNKLRPAGKVVSNIQQLQSKQSGGHPNRVTYAQVAQAPIPSNLVNHPNNKSNHCLLNPDELFNLFQQFTCELLKCNSIEEQISTVARLSFIGVAKYFKP